MNKIDILHKIFHNDIVNYYKALCMYNHSIII